MKKLTLVRQIKASPDTVFQALVSAEGLAAWWGPDEGPVLRAESDPRLGGHYRVRFRMEDDSEHEAVGEFLTLDRPHRVVMSFRWVGKQDDTGPSRIEITLRPIDDHTTLTFIHADLRDEKVRESHERGWIGSLDKLERYFGAAGA